MIIFFTIPIWVVLAFFIFGIGFLGMPIEWIADHMLIISIVIWAIAVFVVSCLAEKNQKPWAISALSLFVAPYMVFVLGFLQMGNHFTDGKWITMLFDLAGTIVAVPLCALPALGILSMEFDTLPEENKKPEAWWIPVNFLLAAALCAVCYFVLFVRF